MAVCGSEYKIFTTVRSLPPLIVETVLLLLLQATSSPITAYDILYVNTNLFVKKEYINYVPIYNTSIQRNTTLLTECSNHIHQYTYTQNSLYNNQ